MRDDQHQQELKHVVSAGDIQGDQAEGEEYAYQESGIRERQGTIPLWLILAVIVLISWGILLHNPILESAPAHLLIEIVSMERMNFEKQMLEVTYYNGRDNRRFCIP